jgi:hypothetical protein
MSGDKRTEDQLNFDGAAHGWAFCNIPMLEGKIERCTEIAKRLSVDDKRHLRLEIMRNALGILRRKRDGIQY